MLDGMEECRRNIQWLNNEINAPPGTPPTKYVPADNLAMMAMGMKPRVQSIRDRAKADKEWDKRQAKRLKEADLKRELAEKEAIKKKKKALKEMIELRQGIKKVEKAKRKRDGLKGVAGQIST
ncbi:hypothetical protein GLAREA_03394 [Glarea lozoyensis ATCC 20868]|uniref:Uncharacterized protein n=1 Tax=Glarea lozoyensis (strain ATCC 20868 / MF5171) TaxID=1116229 RepID=S3CVI7_GLAL2|nr:uncharacterized protein GLAREA_03394 [Glarea lozoyensis ATCC 20868]EPE30427.1 hypothetical protein GLAREA_03394 [Glarea lozoyensis ATCC 20868]